MKRILLLSDSHGDVNALKQIIDIHKSSDKIIFLGDGEADIALVRSMYPSLKITSVRGNNDFSSENLYDEEIYVGGLRIFCTHGHRYSVRFSEQFLADEARARGCAAAFYGHTHVPKSSMVGGIYVVNPGAVHSYPKAQYALIDVSDNGRLFVNLTSLK